MNHPYVVLFWETLTQNVINGLLQTFTVPGMELDKLFSQTGFTQLIKEPTNFEPNKRNTCIDLIFSNQTNLITDSGVHPSLFHTCHHQIIYAKIDLNFSSPPTL